MLCNTHTEWIFSNISPVLLYSISVIFHDFLHPSAPLDWRQSVGVNWCSFCRSVPSHSGKRI